MRNLYIALYSEGSTDARFLPGVIVRTANRLLFDNCDELADVQPILLIGSEVKAQSDDADERILLAARLACNHHLLIVHNDADAISIRERKEYSFVPGHLRWQAVKDAGETVCRELIPLIPKREIESWLLADVPTLLQTVLRVNLDVNKLIMPPGVPRLPKSTSAIETYSKCKEALDHIVGTEAPAHRRLSRNDVYEPMGTTIRMDRLQRLPAFQEFERELKQALTRLGFLPDDANS